MPPPSWITLWFLLTVPVIAWDASYCLLRPRSMIGGDIHWLWKPYELYQEIDYIYGVKFFEDGNGFTDSQAALNIVETFMNLVYLYQAHVRASPAAPLIGFAAALMTFSKTVLYMAQELFCAGAGCNVSHNDPLTLLSLWIIPNGFWLLFPGLIIWRLGREISTQLRAAHSLHKTE